LVGFFAGMKEWLRRIRLFHGEDQAMQRLAEVLRARYREAGKDGETPLG
jgi:metallo-beta-lactamase family protein